MDRYEDVKRIVRAALQSIDASGEQQPSEEPCKNMAAAIQQLAFAVDQLITLIEHDPARAKQ